MLPDDAWGQLCEEWQKLGLERKTEREGGVWLDGDVTDGLEFLCEVLDREALEEEFPHGNKSGRKFEATL